MGLRQRGRCSPVHPLQEAGADIQGNLHVHVDAKDPKLLQTIAEVYQWGGLSRLRKPVDDSERVLPQVFDLDEAREGPGWIGEIIHHGTKQKKILEILRLKSDSQKKDGSDFLNFIYHSVQGKIAASWRFQMRENFGTSSFMVVARLEPIF